MKGRFRSFLLGTLKHFLADARDHARAQKRGGGSVPVQLDEAAVSQAESHAARSQKWNADGIFEREWAASLLRQTVDRLAQEYAIAGRSALFEALKVHLTAGATAGVPYEELAKPLGRACGETCVCELTDTLRVVQPKISRHLRHLERAGLVEARRNGKWIHYRWARHGDPLVRHVLRGLRDWMKQEPRMRDERLRREKVCCRINRRKPNELKNK